MTKILGFLVILAAAGLALPAAAVTWSAIDANPAGAESGAGTVCGAVACQFTVTGGSGSAKFRAYSNSAWMPSDFPGTGIAPIGQNLSGSGTVGGGWVTANNLYYGLDSGFGIKNLVQQGATEEDYSPEHATDNREVLDIMVIELPFIAGQAWDLESFKLGWAQENGLGTATDVSMFIGGAGLGANYDFTNVCFDVSGGTCAATPANKKISNLGFTNITTDIANDGNNLAQDTTIGVTTNATGNYIIVAGRLGEKDDAFKFKSITASTSGGPGGSAPAPGTLALLGLGLLGMVSLRRRPASI